MDWTEISEIDKQYPDELLIARPVSTRVNAPKNNDASLIEAVSA